jgi:hypothetical protein
MAGIGKAFGDYYKQLPEGMMIGAAKSFGITFAMESLMTLRSGKQLKVDLKPILTKGLLASGSTLLSGMLKPAFDYVFPPDKKQLSRTMRPEIIIVRMLTNTLKNAPRIFTVCTALVLAENKILEKPFLLSSIFKYAGLSFLGVVAETLQSSLPQPPKK